MENNGFCKMKVLNKIICWYFGHDLNNCSNEWYCVSCDEYIDYDETIKDSVKYKLSQWWARKKNWIKCPDCGLKFGRHDNNYDHLPF